MTDYVDLITEKCREYYHEKSLLSPSQMAVKIMAAEGFPMHSTHHHYLVPAVLITAACIAENKDEDTFSEYLGTAEKRGMKVPGGYCGEYGACGAAIGCGILCRYGIIRRRCLMILSARQMPLPEKRWRKSADIRARDAAKE